MKVIDILTKSRSTLFSFELLPPLKGHTIDTVFDTIDRLKEFSPAYINITHHREDVVYMPNTAGEPVPVKVRRRPGTISLAAAIHQRYGIDVVPHLICGGFDAHDIEDALIDLDFLGIQNILVLRGDADKISGRFEPKRGGHQHAVELVRQVQEFNRGIYLEKLIENPKESDFCIGVGGYPEKHPEAPNIDVDIRYLKEKVDAGASYVVTQMFFDNAVYFKFVERCREAGIDVPIIPGIKPISAKEQLTNLPRVFNVNIPQALVQEVDRCADNRQVFDVGVEWAVAQSKELKARGAPAIHFYTMGRAENIARVAAKVF
ncbi:MAG TPA: methylenetetrahydrofolate reductase [NAD(P)H] [Tenuifilaceae bacterium]|nr:methylenetetrahydrofolate reductase [NAD(P)H] [Tenuifilaceae bacterium]HQN84685.1 methylenetetrahydrofolate reductase [NAD(P)H] [Tenuifilaceae bacterium]